jgi:hypothetical protein
VGSGALTGLQRRLLELLSTVSPPWTLTGGAALTGFHLHHRNTRDLDLFWRGREKLGSCREDVVARLRAAGLRVDPLHGGDAFQALRVTDGTEVVIVDLVAEPSLSLEPATEVSVGAATIRVDSPHEILVSKLCALLGRAELRDLIDVRELLASGGDLVRALGDAPRRDGGFSPLTLAWVLRGLPVAALAGAAGVDPTSATGLERFRDELVSRITAAGRPRG